LSQCQYTPDVRLAVCTTTRRWKAQFAPVEQDDVLFNNLHEKMKSVGRHNLPNRYLLPEMAGYK
jgi:hypothetical protein